MDKIKPTIYSYPQHRIARKKISPSTLWVVSQLKKNGYDAFVVGGCIRDILLRKKPKDFDVATDARPEEIRVIFPRALIIGKRFQLVHILTGHNVIEVSTFRSQTISFVSRLKMLWFRRNNYLRDNIFGTITEDVLRRDFTINAFYYAPDKQELIDYVNGFTDIKNRLVRSIGNPQKKMREDPMRIIRAIRFTAKLDLSIDSELLTSIQKYFPSIQKLPPARLLDEMQKLFFTGHAVRSFTKIMEHGYLDFFWPQLGDFLKSTTSESIKKSCREFIKRVLICADERYDKEQPLTLVFLLASFLWFPYVAERDKQYDKHKERTKKQKNNEHHRAMHIIFEYKKKGIRAPFRIHRRIEKIWLLQRILLNYERINPQKIMENKNFRIAYDFLNMLASVDYAAEAAAKWWTDYQKENIAVPIKRRRKSRRHKRTRKGFII